MGLNYGMGVPMQLNYRVGAFMELENKAEEPVAAVWALRGGCSPACGMGQVGGTVLPMGLTSSA